ncbi:efflux transporter periplasmic adaptor subunit [Paraburkholderia ginsengiterrae]|uniref:Efflux transporter periplasmic adaptor subunit n=1 Tax=Paraburkholderia ginsengiterrae TaxID=1462993 RepID=A0ABX2UWH8_9BURK|nr:efflux RND transporter periplasmic adaptor subunit [Paraburkholderia ginsengiterrae]OAJ59213.1 efflux transporter periplasmic adaptor subunit [Paraburkholderia ginsengiterrae]
MKSLPTSVPVLCASLCLLALAACTKSTPPAPPPPQVAVTTAHPQTVPLTRQFVGRLSPYYSANVTARVSGVLVKRAYAEGSQVRQGQVLFEIDPSYYKAQLDNDIAQQALDQATYVNNHITAERNRKLLPIGSVSQQTVDNSNAAERSAAAKVQADQALVQSARISVGYTRVTSPISGIAGQQQVTVGAVVGSSTTDAGTSGTLLTTVQQVDPVYVNFTISAADLITLRQSQGSGSVALAQQDSTTVQVSLPNGTPYEHTGKLDFSDPAVNATTGTVNLRALVANPQHLLLPGMYVTLVVRFGQQNNVFLIPQQALLRDTQGAYLLVVGQDGKVVRKNVETNASLGNDWIVTKGIAEGDRVIVTGVQVAHEGMQVNASPWQPPAQPLAAASDSQPASAAH